MDTQQSDLLTTTALLRESDANRIITDCVAKMQSGEWQAAPFQRDFVWKPYQITAWGKTIMNKSSIGVIVTYQLEKGSPVYILDGWQRLNATARYMERPQEYEFSYGPEQARRYCDTFDMPVQHRHYRSHQVAWEYFARLNQGTIVTPYEMNRGLLTMASEAGKLLANEIPPMVASLEAPYIRVRRESRTSTHSHNRDAYSLFLQYTTKTDYLHPWNVTGNNVSPVAPRETPVEVALAAEIERRQWSVMEAERLLKNFRAFLAEQIAEIVAIYRESGGEGRTIAFTLWRWLLHLSIWRRNAGRPVELYRDLLKKLFVYLMHDLSMRTAGSRFILPERDGKRPPVTLSIGGCHHLLEVCRHLDNALYEGRVRRREVLAPGYHSSHVLPFSQHGDGPTIPEPGPRNRARGAKPIEGVL